MSSLPETPLPIEGLVSHVVFTSCPQMNQPLHLRYESIEVGLISDPFFSNGTWFGVFCETLKPETGPTKKRLHEFILFSEDWHAREKTDLSADADEWDAFADLSDRWQTVSADGVTTAICDIPVFVEREVTWATGASSSPQNESE